MPSSTTGPTRSAGRGATPCFTSESGAELAQLDAVGESKAATFCVKRTLAAAEEAFAEVAG